MKNPNGHVAVVDDNESVRRSLQRLLEAEGMAVKTYESSEAFLNDGRPESPGCLILDVRMPGRSGLELQDLIVGSENSVPTVFITGHGDVPMTVRAMKQGATDFLLKPFDDEQLLEAVMKALENDDRDAEERELRNETLSQYSELTPRERQVFGLVVQGLLNKQIARELGIAEKTVKVHRGQVMKKMRTRSVPDLVRKYEMVDTAA